MFIEPAEVNQDNTTEVKETELVVACSGRSSAGDRLGADIRGWPTGIADTSVQLSELPTDKYIGLRT